MRDQGPSRRPTEAGSRWAAVDRAIADQAPYLWLVKLKDVGFVSERVGNYRWGQMYSVLLNQSGSGNGEAAQ